jgi:DNA polymerase III alpha subunit
LWGLFETKNLKSDAKQIGDLKLHIEREIQKILKMSFKSHFLVVLA